MCKAERISGKEGTHNADLTIADFLDFFTYDTTGNSSQSDIPREPIIVFMKIADDSDCLENLGKLSLVSVTF